MEFEKRIPEEVDELIYLCLIYFILKLPCVLKIYL